MSHSIILNYGNALPETEDVDVLLASLGCNRVERRKRSSYGRAFHPCPKCLKVGNWGKTVAESIFPEKGWLPERKELVRWFMSTRVPWLAFARPFQPDTFFVPAWAQHLRIATDLLAYGHLTEGSARGKRVVGKRKPIVETELLVDAPVLMDYALDHPDFRSVFQGLVSLLPREGVLSSAQDLNGWLSSAAAKERRDASTRLFQWLSTNAPPGVMTPPRPPEEEEPQDPFH